MTVKSSQWAATPQLLFSLAEEYKQTALALQILGRKREPLSLAPFRFAAIHAIELYLSAVLLKAGREPDSLLLLGHRLKERAELAKEVGLTLRKRSFNHLETLEASREYQVARYGSGDLKTASPVTQLVATLDDVATKTKLIIEVTETKQRPAPLSR